MPWNVSLFFSQKMQSDIWIYTVERDLHNYRTHEVVFTVFRENYFFSKYPKKIVHVRPTKKVRGNHSKMLLKFAFDIIMKIIIQNQ